MKVVAIIPARMQSKRLPGKALKEIEGLPMLEHVRRRVSLAKNVDEVYVITKDKEIEDVITGYGGKVLYDPPGVNGAMEATASGARDMEADVFLNVQGDEPLVLPEMIDDLVQPFIDGDDLECTHLVQTYKEGENVEDLDTVKAVLDRNNYALFFSREPIPTFRKSSSPVDYHKVIGIYGFSRRLLNELIDRGPCPLELRENVDLLRVLEYGHKIKMVFCDQAPLIGVDNPSDLAIAMELMQKDEIKKKYL